MTTALAWLLSDAVSAAAVRAAIGFVAAWALLKIGKKRFLKRGSAFDALLAIMVGAVLGRGVAEGESFPATLAAAAVIMLAHWLFASMAFRWPLASRIIEGHARPLIEAGRPNRRQMARALVSEADIAQELRLRTGSDDLSLIEAAWQERSGKISLKLKDA